MLWVFYALICAFSLATADMLSKKALATESVPLMVWVRFGFAVPFLLLVIPFIETPKLDSIFWMASLAALPCDMLANLLYLEAIRVSPLSLTLPFLSLTPVFLLGTSWLILGEFPDRSGLAGIFFIFIGAYLLNIKNKEQGILSPLKAIKRERGSVLMIIVAFIYSISSIMGKIAITHSAPVFFGVYYNIALSFVLLPVLHYNPHGKWQGIFRRPKIFLAIGFFIALMMVSHFLAMELTLVSYMISVKRTSMLFGVIYGGLIFKEENIRERFLGSFLMVLGVALIIV